MGVGISGSGSFETSNPRLAGITSAPGYSQVGYSFDADGIGTGLPPVTTHFVLPGLKKKRPLSLASSASGA